MENVINNPELEIKTDKNTQHNVILNYLRQPKPGYITSMSAYTLGITQLGTRLQELEKKGVHFVRTWVKEPGKKKYIQYSLLIFEPKQEELF